MDMLTVIDSLNKSTEYLTRKNIESARLNAELLLADILNCKRLDLYLSFDRPLKEPEIEKYREYIARRGKYEPLQYIIGYTEFYGYRINLNNSVLIPRPETEILVEQIIKENRNRKLTILDIGSGSGCISIALAKNLPKSNVIGLDISSDSLILAELNSQINEVSNLKFVYGDVFQTISFDHKFDLIVSNPPYVELQEYQALQKEIIEYEPKIAVTDFEDGFTFYKRIINISQNLLVSGGKLYFEVGKGQANFVAELLLKNNYHEVKISPDLQNIDRIVQGTL